MNASMVYMGIKRSSTVLHVEPGQFGSINCMLNWGRKAWRIIAWPDMITFTELYQKWRLSTCGNSPCGQKNDKGEVWLCPTCKCPWSGCHAPVFFPSSQFLKEHNITFFDFIQYPCDVVYVNPGVDHCVVNMDFCVAEARTVLPAFLQLCRDEGMCCTCPDLGRQRIGLSLPGFFATLVTKYMCPHPDCQNGSLLDPLEYRRHKA